MENVTNSGGQKVFYTMDMDMTGMEGYGPDFNEILDGKTPIPPEGARFDVTFGGKIEGSKINGTVTGIDYLSMRADGRTDLNIYLNITTDDGEKIFAQITGNSTPRDGSSIIDVRENGVLFTSSEKYKWVNSLQIWANGTVDRATGKIKLTGYSE